MVVFALIGAGLYALVAFNVRKGKNWARILGTVFAALSVFGIFAAEPEHPGGPARHRGDRDAVPAGTRPYFQKQQPFANPYGSRAARTAASHAATSQRKPPASESAEQIRANGRGFLRPELLRLAGVCARCAW